MKKIFVLILIVLTVFSTIGLSNFIVEDMNFVGKVNTSLLNVR